MYPGPQAARTGFQLGDGSMNAHREALALCLLASLAPAQDGATDRMLCDPAAPMEACPRNSCICSEDRLEVVFEQSDSSVLNLYGPSDASNIHVGVFIHAVNDFIQGWAYGIQHDEALLQLRSATFQGTDAEKHFLRGFQNTQKDDIETCRPPPESKCTGESLPGGGYISAVVLSLTDPVALPQGLSLLSRATYAVVFPGTDVATTISFSSRLKPKGSPPIDITILNNGRSTKPTFVRDGRIEIRRDVPFHRGDPDGDGRVSILDAVQVLLFLFVAGPAPSCFEAADFDDDGRIDGSDAVLILRWLILHGSAPAGPGPPGFECGRDPGGSPSDLGCGVYPSC